MTELQSTHNSTLPLSRIVAGYNPRRYFDSRKHDELVASLRLRGMLQPMLVRPAADDGDRYVIVAGGRRYRAALDAFGPDGEVPVIIRAMTDQEALEAAIDENDVRDDASETEQADAAVRVLAACKDDRAEAARRLGWSKTKLDRRLALADLSDSVKLALDERRIKVGHAELLAAVPSDKQDKALETILASGLDVGKTRDLLMRVTQDLGQAIFDRSECTTCPFNSAAQRALFETHIDEGHCTNSGCFALKTQTAEVIAAQEQGDGGAQSAPRLDTPDEDLGDDEDQQVDDTAPDGGASAACAAPRRKASGRPAGAAGNVSGGKASPLKASVGGSSIAARVRELREAAWRTALARTLAGNAEYSRIAVLVGAMSGTLSQIRSDTLKARAGLLVGDAFSSLEFRDRIAQIGALTEAQATTVLSAIGAAYARDMDSFEDVADLARAFGVDLRDTWRIDRAFLERYSKEELKVIARECGLVAHVGEKAFAKLLGAKKADLITGMLNAAGFDWARRLPGAMSLDGLYRAPDPAAAAPLESSVESGRSGLAA